MKYWLMSFSIGLITASIILAIIYFFETPNESEITEDQIRSFLDDENLTVLSNEELYELREENERLNDQIHALEADSNSAEEDEQIDVDENESNDDDLREENNEAPEAEAEASVFELVIEPGMTQSEVAEILVNNGIIEDQTAFIDYLETNNLDRFIQLGTYTVSEEMSIEEIAQEITP